MPSSACDWSSDVCSSDRSEEHTSELQSRSDLVCRLLLEKKKKKIIIPTHSRTIKQAHHTLQAQLTAASTPGSARTHSRCRRSKILAVRRYPQPTASYALH